MDFAVFIESSVRMLVRNIKKFRKPVIIVSTQTFHDANIIAKRNEMEDQFRKAAIPVMSSAETMAAAVRHCIAYKEHLSKSSL